MDYDPLDTTQLDASRVESAKRADFLLKQEHDDLKWLMSGKRGRRVAYRFLARAGIGQSSFNTNALSMAFNEGRRQQGVALFDTIMAICPEHYTTMLEEQKNG